MNNLVKDSRELKEKLLELPPWEIILLNKLYETSLFNNLTDLFKEKDIDYLKCYQNIKNTLVPIRKKKYFENILTSFESRIAPVKYRLYQTIENTPEKVFKEKFDCLSNNDKTYLIITDETQSELKRFNILTSDRDFNGNSLILMKLLNFLSSDDRVQDQFSVLDLMNQMKRLNNEYFDTKQTVYIDILVLSALGRSKIWNRIIKHPENAQKRINNFYEWYVLMKTRYGEYLEYPTHALLNSKKHMNQFAKRIFEKASNSQFIESVRKREYEIVRKFLEDGISVETIDLGNKHVRATHIACKNGDLEMIKLLESYDCDLEALDYEHSTPLFYAVIGEKYEVIEYLLSKGVNLEHKDHQDRTVFYCACCHCSTQMVDYLHKKGCNINSPTKLNRLPLAKAAYFGRGDIVKLLLTYPGVLIENQDNKGRNALHNACWGKEGGREGKKCGSNRGMDNPEAAKALLEAGANIEARDADGNTPLGVAASTFADRCIPMLIEFGANINALNNNLETPLFLASKYAQLEICQTLIEKYQADPFLANTHGIDSIGAAIQSKDYDLVRYFLKSVPLVDQDISYYESLIGLVFQNFEGEARKDILEDLFKSLSLKEVKNFPMNNIKSLLKSKEDKILLCLIRLLATWKDNSVELLSNVLFKVLEEILQLGWIEGLETIKAHFLEEIVQLCWPIHSFPTLTTVKAKEFIYIINNFNINIFEVEPNKSSFLNTLISQRNTESIVELFQFFNQLIKRNETAQNLYLKNLSIDQVSTFILSKNEKGVTPIECALIYKYHEISSIMSQFIGESLEVTLAIPKYQINIVDKTPVYTHSQKQLLHESYMIMKNGTERRILRSIDAEENFEENKIKESLNDWSQRHKQNKELIFETILLERNIDYIDTVNKLDLASQELKKSTLVGVDVEYYIEDYTNKLGFVCLLQISSIEKDYLIDGIALHGEIKHYLSEIFLSDKIVKVFHGCENDLKWLKADFDIDIINLFDTSKAAMLISNQLTPPSLSWLTSNFLGYTMDKSYQKADWRIRPIPKGMIDYARMDASVLLFLWRILNQQLSPEQSFKMKKKMIKKCWNTVEQCVYPIIKIKTL